MHDPDAEGPASPKVLGSFAFALPEKAKKFAPTAVMVVNSDPAKPIDENGNPR